MDTNLLSNIHKLFSERIDIFSPVEFNKVENKTLLANCCYYHLTNWPMQILIFMFFQTVWPVFYLVLGLGANWHH